MDVVQVIPKDDYQVFVYFADGIIKKYSVAHLECIVRGRMIFRQLVSEDAVTAWLMRRLWRSP